MLSTSSTTEATALLARMRRGLLARVQATIRLAKVRREVDQVLREESLRILRLLERASSFICLPRGPDHVFEFANAAYRLSSDDAR
jgi:hypothetical protein